MAPQNQVDVYVNGEAVKPSQARQSKPGEGKSRAAKQRKAKREAKLSQEKSIVLRPSQGRSMSVVTRNVDMAQDVYSILACLTRPQPGMKVPAYTPGGIGQATHRLAVQHIYNLSSAEVGNGVTAFLFRRPGANLILIQAAPTSSNWKYAMRFISQCAPDGATPDSAGGGSWVTVAGQEYDLKCVMGEFVAQNTDDWQKNDGDFIALASKDYPAKRFIYMDAGEIMTYGATPVANTNFVLKAYRLFDGNLNLELSNTSATVTAGTPGTIGVTIAHSGYYCFSLTCSSGTTLNAQSLSYVGTQASVALCHRHLCMNFYCANIQWLPKVRVLSSTLLGTNSTADLYKGGDDVQVNINAGTPWEGLASYNALAALPSAVPDDANEGTFTQLRIVNKEQDLSMKSLSINTGGSNPQLADSLETVEPDADYCGVSYSLAGLGGNQLLKFTLDTAVEFVSLNNMYPGDHGSTLPAAWDEALIKVSVVPQFTRNKIHLAQIGNAIKSIAGKTINAILKYGPMVVKGAEITADYLEKGASLFV